MTWPAVSESRKSPESNALQLQVVDHTASQLAAHLFIRADIVAAPLGAGDVLIVIPHLTECQPRIDGRADRLHREIVEAGSTNSGSLVRL